MSGVTITTYTMVSFSGRRSEESQKVSACTHLVSSTQPALVAREPALTWRCWPYIGSPCVLRLALLGSIDVLVCTRPNCQHGAGERDDGRLE